MAFILNNRIRYRETARRQCSRRYVADDVSNFLFLPAALFSAADGGVIFSIKQFVVIGPIKGLQQVLLSHV